MDMEIGHSSQECTLEMSYLRGTCEVTRWDGERNENVYERRDIGLNANEIKCV